MYRVATICEGPADRAVLHSVLDHYLEDYEPLPIQPPTGLIGGDSGPFGGGWKGVKSWCQQEARVGNAHGILPSNADLLIIQVDADVACEAEHQPLTPCPPVDDRCDYVRGLILSWLSLASIPRGTVACVPAAASETWAFIALYPDNQEVVDCGANGPPDCIECRLDAKQILRRASKKRKPKLVVQQDGKLKNQASGFDAAAEEITAGWRKVVRHCQAAALFDMDLQAELP